MANGLRIALAQMNLLVGDIQGNVQKIIDTTERARDKYQADVIIFPELSLCGYPPEDLLFRDSMLLRVRKERQRLLGIKNIVLIIGLPEQGGNGLENRAQALYNGDVLCDYAKRNLPNDCVFDEKRYFTPGASIQKMVFSHKGISFGLGICEDYWSTGISNDLTDQRADIMLNLSASPFHQTKERERMMIMRTRCQETNKPMVYVNMIGGQDELVFDGGSFVMQNNGDTVLKGDNYQEKIYLADYDKTSAAFKPGYIAPAMTCEEYTYKALVQGVYDYVNKNGFKGVVLGLSGGIDSALVSAIAVDALGKENVEAVMMPFLYTSKISMEDARAEADALGIAYRILPIEPAYNAFMQILSDEFSGTKKDTTEENLQARCRGIILMAISNKKGYLVLTTGNKSEMSVGYATLYGDMAGGFGVLKNVPKTMVYRLAKWRNLQSEVIPERVISRPPSAELAPDQTDQDTLPPYEILDQILKLYIEEDQSAESLVKKGFDRDTVYRVIRLIDTNEYKRRQAAIGIRITPKSFGKDRRYPITSGWKAGE